MIFGQIDNFYILVEFEVDRMCPSESTKNEQKGAQGLNWKFFVNFEDIFDILDKNKPRKQNFMSLRQLKNFRDPTCIWITK